MKARDFEASLDRFGSDLSRWSDKAARNSAEVLLSSSVEARRLLARAVHLAALIDSVDMPPPPSLESIVEQATARPQLTFRRLSRPATGRRGAPIWPGWLGLGQWQALTLASCLVLGIAVGVGGTSRSDIPDSVYDMVDSSHIEVFHE